MNKIAEVISEGIKEGRWIDIVYNNKKDEETRFWFAITDINFKGKILFGRMYNISKEEKVKDGTLLFDRIKDANIIFFSSYDVPLEIIEKLEKDKGKYSSWLNFHRFDCNILNYYKEANYLDNDPFQKSYCLISGIHLDSFKNNKKIALSEKQEEELIKKVYNNEISNLSKKELVISCLAISNNNKKYVICYHNLTYNPDNRILKMDARILFNQTFLIDGKKHSLSRYVDGDVEGFIKYYSEKTRKECEEIIKSNLKNGEILDSMPDIMILERDIPINLLDTYKIIEEQYDNGTLSYPLKAFFGDYIRNVNRTKEPSIFIYDDRINIDQMRVIYNSLKQPITYVQGPPGTGKTQTLLNVLLSSFMNDKTVLVCSSNNIPVDGIKEKLTFKYKDEEVLFPFLRLGNKDEVIKSTKKIYELSLFKTNLKPDEIKLAKLKNYNDFINKSLNERLKNYEKKLDNLERIKVYDRLRYEFLNNNKYYNKIIKEIGKFDEENNELGMLDDDSILDLSFNTVSQNNKMYSYLYFKSLYYINKLKMPRFKELIDICSINDDETRAKEFNNWVSQDENIKLLTSVFPIILTTNISSAKLGTPYHKFEIVIMDEAGQCNVAHSLLPISRASNLLLVGDTNQLKPVIVLEDSTNEELMKKYKVDKSYDYKDNSILSVMKEHDKISKSILLSYHYRCGKKIIKFSNARYYNDKLRIEKIKDTGNLNLLDVKNNISSNKRNVNIQECLDIIDYIKRNNVKDAMIITPFVNQQEKMNELLKQNNITDVTCGTIHSLQGSEKNTIILSTSISPKTSKETFNWLKNNAELINVGTTRAKENLVIAADCEVLEKLSDKTDDLYALVDYVGKNGETKVCKSLATQIEIGKSNNSQFEKEFYKTISHFCSTQKDLKAKSNVAFSEIFKEDPILSELKMEFDFVLYEKTFIKFVPKIVIEINGGEHFGDYKREYNDERKREICKQKGIDFISIPNSFVKSYETIKEILLSILKRDYKWKSNYFYIK